MNATMSMQAGYIGAATNLLSGVSTGYNQYKLNKKPGGD